MAQSTEYKVLRAVFSALFAIRHCFVNLVSLFVISLLNAMHSADVNLRAMRPDEWDKVAELICDSTNRWYQAGNKPAIFPNGPASCRLFCEVYEDLDPGCCVVAEDAASGQLLGTCFYHPRETHVSLGIMNAHPDAFSRGVAGKLLRYIIDFAVRQSKPVRLVSSAMNLDSFSLYNRNGFVPRKLFQDMFVPSSEKLPHTISGYEQVRDATPDDVPAMVALEDELVHIRRESDYRYFIENRRGVWHASVYESSGGKIDGFLVSIAHPGSNMLGPGVMRNEEQAAALILKELRVRAGATPVLLAPVECSALVQTLYTWGARNCEIHFAQVRGEYQSPSSVVMPTFMPETWLFSFAVAIGGAVWAWLYHRSGSLVGPWLSHLLVDAAIFAVGYDLVFGVGVSPA